MSICSHCIYRLYRFGRVCSVARPPCPGKPRAPPQTGWEKKVLDGRRASTLNPELLNTASEHFLLKGEGLAQAIKSARTSAPERIFAKVSGRPNFYSPF